MVTPAMVSPYIEYNGDLVTESIEILHQYTSHREFNLGSLTQSSHVSGCLSVHLKSLLDLINQNGWP